MTLEIAPEAVTRPLSLAHVKSLLEAEQAERGELTYEQKLALEQSLTFARTTPEVADKLFAALEGIDKLTDAQRLKIVDLAPVHEEDVRTIFAKERLALDESDIKTIIDAVESHVD